MADYFLKIDGVPGNSVDAKHKGEIEVESFSFGLSNPAPAAGTGAGSGRARFQDLNVAITPSTAGPTLLLSCASGQHHKSAILTARTAAGSKSELEFLTLTLSDVLVSAYQEAAPGGDVGPMDQVSLNFAKIRMEYKDQSTKGGAGPTSVAGWDVKANQKF